MTTYRRRMPKFEAVQIPVLTDNIFITKYLNQCMAIAAWCGGDSHMMVNEDEYAFEGAPIKGPYIQVPTDNPDIWQIASPGDYIAKNPDGTFQYITKKYFEDNYIEVIA